MSIPAYSERMDIMRTAIKIGELCVVKALLENDFTYSKLNIQAGISDIDVPEMSGNYSGGDRSLLMYAVHYGHEHIIEYLLSLGVDIDEQSHFGKTALLCAVQSNRLDMVKLLLVRGAKYSVVEVEDERCVFGMRNTVARNEIISYIKHFDKTQKTVRKITKASSGNVDMLSTKIIVLDNNNIQQQPPKTCQYCIYYSNFDIDGRGDCAQWGYREERSRFEPDHTCSKWKDCGNMPTLIIKKKIPMPDPMKSSSETNENWKSRIED